MLEQIYKPVLWVDCILALKAAGAEHIVECGPGRVLNGLTKRIDRDFKSLSTDDACQSRQRIEPLFNLFLGVKYDR